VAGGQGPTTSALSDWLRVEEKALLLLLLALGLPAPPAPLPRCRPAAALELPTRLGLELLLARQPLQHCQHPRQQQQQQQQ
jgi:hypothetical protein